MFPPFDEDLAREVCKEMICELEQTLKQVQGDEEGGNKDDNLRVSDKKLVFAKQTGMFGALVCLNSNGERVVLKAFSGACGGRWNIEGFAPPLFDEEKYNAAIQINDKKIHELSVAAANETPAQKAQRKKERLRLCNETLERIYALYKFTCFDGVARTFADLVEHIQSQKMPENSIDKFELPEDAPKRDFLIPTGTGDCCAPKLLSYAFSQNLTPVSLAEFFWNAASTSNKSCNALTDSKPKTDRAAPALVHKDFYPPCNEKCGLILPLILGLKIIYRDEHIIVVDKPSGLLSVPGRGADKQDCVVRRVQKLFPTTIEQPSVHRLDMDTSGLLVLAFNAQSQRALSMQFQEGTVTKKYIAVLDGVPNNKALGITRSTNGGRIELKHRVDIENRPRQIYDEVYGKTAITNWRRERVWTMRGSGGTKRVVTTVSFEPLTGRTHQLRFASASLLGLNAPIIGDNIYGVQNAGERLLLHASYLNFTHPATGARMEFTSEPEFKY